MGPLSNHPPMAALQRKGHWDVGPGRKEPVREAEQATVCGAWQEAAPRPGPSALGSLANFISPVFMHWGKSCPNSPSELASNSSSRLRVWKDT